MTPPPIRFPDAEPALRSSARVGFYAAVLTVIATIITFAFAISALPNSGGGCVADCFTYPYLDTLSQYPVDYYWMLAAMVQLVLYLVLITAIHACAPVERKIYSHIALSLAIAAAIILLGDYFVQFSVVPISLMQGETEGITMLTQYNPHGVFIVLEELGYILMSLSFLFLAPIFARRSRLEMAVRWIFAASPILMLLAFVPITISYGLDRQDRFEIAAISIDWLVLIVNGILLGIVFRRQLSTSAPAETRTPAFAVREQRPIR
jgi:hypothetical protein